MTEEAARIAARYSAFASTYATLWSPVIRPMALPLFGALRIAKAERILDVGCGAGGHFQDIRAAAPGASLFGADYSEGMLGIARASTPVVVADSSALPFRPRTFDATVFVFMLQHVADPPASVACAAEVTRSGGVVATVTWGPEREYEAEAVWREEMDAAGATPLEPPIDSSEMLDTPKKMAALFAGAGISVEKTWTTHPEHRWSPPEMWILLTEYGRTKQRLESLSPDARAVALDRVRDRFAALGPDAYAWTAGVIFCVGRV